MRGRPVRKMLRDMAGGGPVEVALAMATMKKLAHLSFYAEQFGYAYADVRQGGDPQGHGYVLMLVPDPDPGARARAARNQELYPDARHGGPLPPLVPDTVALLRARITFDVTAMYTDRQRIALTGIGVIPVAVLLGVLLGSGGTAVALGLAVWATLMGIVPLGFALTRRYRTRCAAQLEAAGFTATPDSTGRLRYVPPRLPHTAPPHPPLSGNGSGNDQ